MRLEYWMFVRSSIASEPRRSVGAAHQNAVEVISGHIDGRSGQQGPRLSFVVCDESLDVLVHQFVGEVHAVNPLHLGHNAILLSCDLWHCTMIIGIIFARI